MRSATKLHTGSTELRRYPDPARCTFRKHIDSLNLSDEARVSKCYMSIYTAWPKPRGRRLEPSNKRATRHGLTRWTTGGARGTEDRAKGKRMYVMESRHTAALKKRHAARETALTLGRPDEESKGRQVGGPEGDRRVQESEGRGVQEVRARGELSYHGGGAMVTRQGHMEGCLNVRAVALDRRPWNPADTNLSKPEATRRPRRMRIRRHRSSSMRSSR